MRFLLLLLSFNIFADSYVFIGNKFNNEYFLITKKLEHLNYTFPFLPKNYGMIIENKANKLRPLSNEDLKLLDKNQDLKLSGAELNNINIWNDYNNNLNNDFGEINKAPEIDLACTEESLNLIDLKVCKGSNLLALSSSGTFSLSSWNKIVDSLRKNYLDVVQFDVAYDVNFVHGYIIKDYTDKRSETNPYLKALYRNKILKLENCTLKHAVGVYMQDFEITCSDESLSVKVNKQADPIIGKGDARIKTDKTVVFRDVQITKMLVIPKFFQKLFN